MPRHVLGSQTVCMLWARAYSFKREYRDIAKDSARIIESMRWYTSALRKLLLIYSNWKLKCFHIWRLNLFSTLPFRYMFEHIMHSSICSFRRFGSRRCCCCCNIQHLFQKCSNRLVFPTHRWLLTFCIRFRFPPGRDNHIKNNNNTNSDLSTNEMHSKVHMFQFVAVQFVFSSIHKIPWLRRAFSKQMQMWVRVRVRVCDLNERRGKNKVNTHTRPISFVISVHSRQPKCAMPRRIIIINILKLLSVVFTSTFSAIEVKYLGAVMFYWGNLVCCCCYSHCGCCYS